MSNYQELVGILKELLTNRFYPKPYYIRGLLGDGNGNVIVPNRPGYNYVRFNRASNETFEVFNKEVSQPVDGWPVLIGSFPWQDGLIQVVGTDWSAYSQTGWGDSVASIQAHAPTHEWPTFAPGSDALNVYPRALTPLRTQAVGSGSSSVYVTAYEYDWTGTSQIWPGVPPLDFSAKPPSGSMLYMGVYLNPTTNTLGVVSGSTTVYTDALEPPIPAWPLGVYPSGYVRLYGGQAGIIERDIRPAQRIYNSTLMFTGTSSGGGSGGNVWPKPDKLNIGATEYATAALAVAALAGGDQLLIGEGSFTCDDETATENIAIHGAGVDVSVLTVADAAAVLVLSGTELHLQDFSVAMTAATTSGAKALSLTGTDAQIEARDIKAVMTGAAGGTHYAAYVDTSSDSLVVFIDCYFAASGTGTNIAFNLATGNVRIEGGYIAGDITILAGQTLVLDGPVITGTITNGGTISGWYVDSSGSIWAWDGSAFVELVEMVAGTVDNAICDGRLTLATGVPVTTADQTAKTTLYFTPYKGDKISLYDGSAWATYTFAELSYPLTGLAINKNYDAFVYDSAGTIYLDIVAWTNDTTRATALTTQDGVLVKSGDATWRYVGTWRTTGTTGQTEDSLAKRFVWNFYNRVDRPGYKEGTTSHTYATATWRYWNNDTTLNIEFVIGVLEDAIYAGVEGNITPGAGADGIVAFGLNTASGSGQPAFRNGVASATISAGVSRALYPVLGYNYISFLEFAVSGTVTFPNGRISATLRG